MVTPKEVNKEDKTGKAPNKNDLHPQVFTEMEHKKKNLKKQQTIHSM